MAFHFIPEGSEPLAEAIIEFCQEYTGLSEYHDRVMAATSRWLVRDVDPDFVRVSLQFILLMTDAEENFAGVSTMASITGKPIQCQRVIPYLSDRRQAWLDFVDLFTIYTGLNVKIWEPQR